MRIKTTLRIFERDLNPIDIDQATGIASTRSYRRGDKRVTKKGRVLGTQEYGHWGLRSPLSESTSIEEHLRWLLSRAEKMRDVLVDVRSKGGSINVFVGVFEVADDSGLDITHGTMERLGTLGIDLLLDLYVE